MHHDGTPTSSSVRGQCSRADSRAVRCTAPCLLCRAATALLLLPPPPARCSLLAGHLLHGAGVLSLHRQPWRAPGDWVGPAAGGRGVQRCDSPATMPPPAALRTLLDAPNDARPAAGCDLRCRLRLEPHSACRPPDAAGVVHLRRHPFHRRVDERRGDAGGLAGVYAGSRRRRGAVGRDEPRPPCEPVCCEGGGGAAGPLGRAGCRCGRGSRAPGRRGARCAGVHQPRR